MMMATRKLNPPREREPRTGLARKTAKGRIASRSMANGTPTSEEIRMRAYQLYIERGGSHGRDLDDWYAAERQLVASRAMQL